MWKKLGTVIIALLGTFSVVYAVDRELSATSSTYNAGGSITGRVNMNPSNLSVNGLGLQKGDKILFGNNDLAWILMYPQTYDDYENTGTNDASGWPNAVTTNPSVTAWLAMTSTSLGNMVSSDTAFSVYSASGGIKGTAGYATSKVAGKIADLNDSFSHIDNYEKIVAPRNLALARTASYSGSTQNTPVIANYYTSKYETLYTNEHGKKAFTPGFWTLTRLADSNYNNYTTKRADFAFPNKYWSTDYAVIGSNNSISWYGFESGGDLTFGSNAGYMSGGRDTRAAIWFDLTKSVFAVSNSSSKGLASVKNVQLTNGYTSLYTEAMRYDDMKVRLESPNLTSTTSLTHIENKDGNITSKTAKGSKIYLQADANIGNDGKGGVNTVSVLLFDESNNFVYYQPLEKAKGTGLYEFDTTDLAVGKYKIGIVNEVYNEDSSAPANSSAISDVKELEIVNPLSIEYEAVYEGTNADGTARITHEYTKNVDAGNTIGQIKYKNGVSPYTFTLTQDPSDADSYKNFEIDTLDSDGKTTASSASPLAIKIKSNAPDLNSDTNSLKAGTYKFCITAKDANGDPVDSDGNLTQKLCESVVVDKTLPTVTFDSDDDGTTNVIVDSTQTTTHSEHATHTNLDIADDDVKIIYSHASGPTSIIDSGLPFTSAAQGDKANIVFKPNMSGSIKIQAKIETTDNYLEATTTKTLDVQLKLSGSYAEDKTNITSGSAASKPPASKVEANRIGHIVTSGGTTPYTYELTNGYGNNSSFDIDTKGNIYVNASETLGLAPGDYEIEVVIKDKAGDSQQSATVQKKLTIGAAKLSGVGWDDPANKGNVVTGNTITVIYDPASSGGSFNTKLLETTTDSLKNTTIAYTLDPNPNDAISMSQVGDEAVVTIQKASDATTLNNVKLKAKITGGIYGNDGVTTDIYVNVEKYTQTIAFKDTTKLKLPVGSACVSVPAEITSTYHISNPVIQYETSNTNANAPFTINVDGKICPTTVEADAGTASLTGKLSGDDNFKAATTPTPRMIEVYKPGDIEVSGSIQDAGTANVTYSEGTHLVANDTSTNKNGTATVNKQVAEITDPSGGSLSFVPSSNTGSANIDIDKFNVTSTGFITLKQDIYAADIDAHATGNIYYIQVDVTDANNFTKTIDVQIVIDSAKADFYFIDPVAGTKLPLDHLYVDGTTSVPVYQTAYEKDGTITLKANKGATFKEDPTGASDVIEQTNGGKFKILNASDPNGTYGGSGGNTYVEACMSAGGGYNAQCIYAQVEITKGEQPDFSFVNSPQWKLGKTPVEIQPIYRNQLSTGDVVLQSSDSTIIEPTTYVSGTDQSFKTTGKTGTVTLSAIAPEDRNYQSKKATTTIIVSDTPPTSLTLSMSSPTYGDTNAKAQITNGYKAGTPAYFYTDDPSILSVDTTAVNGKESTTFTAHKASDTITVKVCQIKDPFDPAVDDCTSKGGDYGEITIQVKKKPIAFTFNDETIYTGEAFPTCSFKETSASNFAFTDTMSDITIPENASAACSDTLTKGEYDITGTYSETEKNNVMKNYDITVNNGKLTIKQDTPKDSWYELQDDAGNVLSSDNWYNHDVNVVLKNATGDGGTYDQISDSDSFIGSDLTKYKVTKEDDNLKDVYFRIDPASAVDHAGAISEKTQTHVKIDKTPPIITSLTGEEVNQNVLARVVNTITFGRYMKPGTQVEVKANDQPKGQSAISGLKEIEYTIYTVDEDGNVDIQNPYDTDTISASETTKLPILSNGKYEVCAVAKDHAGNPSQEKCTKLWLKPIGEDSDGDGIPDINIDTDGDSILDLNITKNPGDKIPWLNIDTNGDGKPDMNIDLDGDGTPDLNTGIITKWVCDKMGDINEDGDPDYKTSSTVKGINNIDTNGNNIPDLNIDLDLDGLPELNINIDGNLDKPQTNIDGNGDGKATINIDTKGNGIPEQNVMSIPEWNPDHKVYKDGKIIYETMDLEFKPIEELEDNGVVVKPKDEHVSISPDMKLDVNNITSSTSEAEKEEIRLRSGLKNSEVKQVYNVNLLEENKIIQPNGKVEVKIPIDTNIKNPRIMMKAKDGTWQMMEAKAEGNYYVFETDYIGDVSVLGDQEATANDPSDDKTEDPKDDTKTPTPTDTSKNPDTSVKGTYAKGSGTNTIGMGGALTGDSTNVMLYIGIAGLALIMLIIASRRKHKE